MASDALKALRKAADDYEAALHRTSAEKVWNDLMNEAAAKFCAAALDGVAKALKGRGKAKAGNFGSASSTVKVGDKVVKLAMGFRGGSVGTVYIRANEASQPSYKDEIVVSNHTPTSFGIYVVGVLKREVGWDL